LAVPAAGLQRCLCRLPPPLQRALDVEVARLLLGRRRVPGPRVADDRDEGAVRVRLEESPDAVGLEDQLRRERRDRLLRRVVQRLVVQPGVEVRREVAVEDAALVGRRPLLRELLEDQLLEAGEQEERVDVALLALLREARLLRVPAAEVLAGVAL